MMGNNPIRKQDLWTGDLNGYLVVHSMWHTLQGEGPFSGRPAVFIRLWGCNLKCYWCDTDFESQYQTLSAEAIVQHVKTILGPWTNLVVITGGEPFRQNISRLVTNLNRSGLDVQIETAGTLTIPDFPWHRCHVVVSPKTGKINPAIRQNAMAWKYIIKGGETSDEDGLPGKSTQVEGRDMRLARPPDDFPLDQVYLSPCDEGDVDKNTRNTLLATALCLEHGYRLSLQTHKIVGVD